MQFTDTYTHETHVSSATVSITGAEKMQDETLRYNAGARRVQAVQVDFLPEYAHFSWRWDDDLGWVLTSLKVTGPTIKKDGTLGVQSRTVNFMRAGGLIETTSPELITLAEELAPKSYVGQE